MLISRRDQGHPPPRPSGPRLARDYVALGSRPPLLALASATAVHIGDGRDVMARPVGPTKVSSSLALPDMVQPPLWITWWWCTQSSTRLSRSVRPSGFQPR